MWNELSKEEWMADEKASMSGLDFELEFLRVKEREREIRSGLLWVISELE